MLVEKLGQKVEETYDESCRGISAIEVFAVTLPFARQTLRSRVCSTRARISNCSLCGSNRRVLRSRGRRISIRHQACCVLGRLCICTLELLETDRSAVDRQRVDVKARRKRLVQGSESGDCGRQKSLLVHFMGQARTGSSTCRYFSGAW